MKTPPYLMRLRARNFRSLKDVEVQLQPLNVLVGPNGAGKSNLLDVIAFLGDSGREDLGPAVTSRGGFERVRFRGLADRSTEPLSIEIEAAVTKNSNRKASDNYTLAVRPLYLRRRGQFNRGTILARDESFLFKRTAGPGRRINISGSDLTIVDDQGTRQSSLREDSLGLASLPKLEPDKGGEQVDALLSLFASFRVFDINVERARLPYDEKFPGYLADDAGNLAAFLYYLHENFSERFSDLQEDARAFVPGLQELIFESVGGPTEAVVLRLKEEGLRDLTDLADASFGSIRALALLAVLYDPDPPKLTCIEEIDHGLHPYILDRLVELLRKASRTTQLLIATHSPSLVNRLRPNELIVCERREDGSSRIPAIAPETVRQMEADLEGELSLGELWFTGALGGVPEV